MIKYFTPKIRFSKERIYKRLHIDRDTPVCDYTEKVFPEIVCTMETDLHLKACYRVLSEPIRVGLPQIDNAEYQVVCAIICNDSIMQSIDAYLSRSDFLQGYLLNDLTNDVIFDVSNQMNLAVANEMASRGCRLSTGCFPGVECDLSVQRALLDCLQINGDLREVSLTECHMIVPEKSMLYIFGADPSFPLRSLEHDCSACPNIGCFFRTDEAENYLCKNRKDS